MSLGFSAAGSAVPAAVQRQLLLDTTFVSDLDSELTNRHTGPARRFARQFPNARVFVSVITVEESQTFGVDKDIVTGMRIDKGYVSHYMVTNQDRMEAEYSDPYILVTDKKISSVQELVPILEKVLKTGKKELVIVELVGRKKGNVLLIDGKGFEL
jgi:hypothetical protein